MKPIKNDLILRALRGENTSRTPVWLMRQAGRYLPEYRSVRAKAGSFMDLCRTPELACEVTLQPLRRYDLDAAIIFSDILTVPDAMGLGLSFLENEGPVFERPLRTESDILSLCKPDVMKDLKYVFDAITLTKKELDGSVPLIGFCGSAFTLACYMIEGRGSKGFPRVKELLYSRPELMHTLLDKITDASSTTSTLRSTQAWTSYRSSTLGGVSSRLEHSASSVSPTPNASSKGFVSTVRTTLASLSSVSPRMLHWRGTRCTKTSVRTVSVSTGVMTWMSLRQSYVTSLFRATSTQWSSRARTSISYNASSKSSTWPVCAHHISSISVTVCTRTSIRTRWSYL